MTEEVRSRGLPASKARVERLINSNGTRARHKRRYPRQPVPAQAAGRAEYVQPQLPAGLTQSGVRPAHPIRTDEG